MIDFNDTPTAPADPRDTASLTKTFLGKALEPFSVRRQMAAQAMGNRLLCGRVQLEQGGAYDGMFVDVVGVMWLCSRGKADVMKAIRLPDQAMGDALDWAERNKLDVGSAAFREACEIYGEIMAELSAAQYDITEEAGEGSGSKNASGDQALEL